MQTQQSSELQHTVTSSSSTTNRPLEPSSSLLAPSVTQGPQQSTTVANREVDSPMSDEFRDNDDSEFSSTLMSDETNSQSNNSLNTPPLSQVSSNVPQKPCNTSSNIAPLQPTNSLSVSQTSSIAPSVSQQSLNFSPLCQQPVLSLTLQPPNSTPLSKQSSNLLTLLQQPSNTALLYQQSPDLASQSSNPSQLFQNTSNITSTFQQPPIPSSSSHNTFNHPLSRNLHNPSTVSNEQRNDPTNQPLPTLVSKQNDRAPEFPRSLSCSSSASTLPLLPNNEDDQGPSRSGVTSQQRQEQNEMLELESTTSRANVSKKCWYFALGTIKNIGCDSKFSIFK